MIEDIYDRILRDHPREIVAAQAQSDAEMIKRQCLFDGQPLPHFLKPYFLSVDQTQLLAKKSTCLIGVLEKIAQLYFTRPEVQSMFSLTELTADLIDIDPGYARTIVISRPDAFIGHGGLQFIELNCDSPAGAVYTDLEEEILLTSFPMQALRTQVSWERSDRKAATLEALLACYREFGGTQSHPTIAIMDWREVKTRGEFVLLKQYYESRGHEVVIADPRDMIYANGELTADGIRIDLIYRRVIFRELVDRIDTVQDFIAAYRAQAVCVVNSLRSRLAANKSMLSVLTNPAYDHLFTAEENAVKEQYIPWTRRIIDAEKFYGGKKRYLMDLVVDHQDGMVLKPSDGYGGKDVHIGRETTRKDWARLTQQALDSIEDWVVQAYVDIPTMTVPVVRKGKMKMESKKVNVNPYVFNGQYAGGVARLSDRSIINVSAGGGLIPAMTYVERI